MSSLLFVPIISICEISKTDCISFVICNDGYTIERYIHGWEEQYNDIQPWNNKDLVPAFGAKKGHYKTYQVRTVREIEDLFANEEFSSAPFLQVSLYCPSSFL